MNICHIVFCADTVSYMVAKALSSAGHNVYIFFGDPGHEQAALNKIKLRLLNIPRVKILSEDDDIFQKEKYDRLIIQMFPRPHFMESCKKIQTLARLSQHITLITAGDRSYYWRTAYKMQWKELRAFGRWINKIDRIVYKDGFHKFDLFTLFKSRRVLGFDIHSMFMADEDKFEYIQKQDWKVATLRPYCINFMGSQDPTRRKLIMDSIRQLFTESEQALDTPHPSKNNFWQEYSDAKPAALGLEEFVDILTNSDFTLCPPGYSLITHRLIEALLRGSIPILNANELDIYDIGLIDGVNCIAVLPEEWSIAINRCFEMDEKDIIKMRKNIAILVKEQLLYPISSKKIRLQLSVL